MSLDDYSTPEIPFDPPLPGQPQCEPPPAAPDPPAPSDPPTAAPDPPAAPTPEPGSAHAPEPALPAVQQAPTEADGPEQINDDEPAWKHGRTGKIARLPHETRERVNLMLRDNVPLRKILASLGDQGKDINEDNLSNWKAGGYQDWLLEQRRAADLGRTREAALSLVKQEAGNTVQNAGRSIASAQLYELLLSFDPTSLVDLFKEKPELYFRLVTTLARLSEGEARCSRRLAQGSLIEDQLVAGAKDGDKRPVITGDRLHELIRLIKLV
jgi:hypothetical protein